MNLTPEEASALLSLYKTKTETPLQEIFESLIQKGYVYSKDGKSMHITKAGKDRIGNHILKERNLPEYVNKYSLPESFDKFFSTASVNAVNALCIAAVNAEKFVGLNKITLQRMAEQIQAELLRQEKQLTILKKQ
jgi:hypothetical protein